MIDKSVYTVEVKVTDNAGEVVFSLKTDAKAEDLIQPGFSTPGLGGVSRFIARAV